ncbi:MAG: CARDB domain-containing protein [Thermoplasmata archaeon]
MNIPPFLVCLLMVFGAWLSPSPIDVDLSVKSVEVSYPDEIGFPGENITVKITFYSTTTNLQAEYVVCFNDNFYHGKLNFKNKTEIVSLNFTLPNAGKYTLRAVMDPQNEITETDETNNELIATVYSCDIFLALDFLKEKILSLPDACFKPPAEQRRNALGNKIDAAKSLVIAGNYTEFIDKMRNDIRAKMDGSGNNDWIINATAQKMLCKIIDRILWQDYDNDGLEIGLVKAQGNGTPLSWQKDEDPNTTTDPLNPDTDNDGLLDGTEDADHNGRVDLYEPDPNDPDSDDDGILDGNKNTVTEIYLRKIVLAGYEITTGKFYAIVNKNATLSPYSGYRVPEAGYWEFSGKSVNGTIAVNELIAVSFFMNRRIELHEENVSNSIASFQFCKNQSENFTLSNENLLLEMESVLCPSGFADPNATNNDTDNDGIND